MHDDFAIRLFSKQIVVLWHFFVSVVHQEFSSEASNEYVIVGNDALMKCIIPSFVSDLVQVAAWTDNEDNVFYKQSTHLGTSRLHFSI